MKLAKIIVITAFLLCLGSNRASALFAQSGAKPKIASIKIEGNIKSDPELIVIATGLSVDQEFNLDDIQKAMENLWQMNVFKDIQVFGEQTENGIAVVFEVKEYPRLENLEINGTDEIEEKDVRSKFGLFNGQTVSPQHIKKATERVRQLYASEGYRNVEIDVKSYNSETDTGKVLLKIEIEENDKVKIRGITFHGNTAFSNGKLEGAFDDTKAKRGFWKWFKSGDFDEKKYNEDLKKLLMFYKKRGFRDIQIMKDSVYYAQNNKDLYIDIWVEEGVKYHIGNISFTGNTLFSGDELTAALGFERGDVYDQEKYDRNMQERVNALYYDRGYIYAQLVPIERPSNKDTLNLEFVVTEGNQVDIERVEIRDNTKTKEKVIRRETVAYPGEKFSRDALIRTQRNLMVLNYFETVIPDVQPVSQDKVNVIITVKEKPTDTANLSIGYSAQDGLIGSAGVAFNNFLGNGQVVNLNLQLGGAGYKVFSIGFQEPYLFDTRTSFGASMYYSIDGNRRAQYVGYKSQSYGGSVNFGRRLKWPDDFFTASWSVAYGNSKLKPLSTSQVSDYIAYGHTQSVTLSQVINRDSRDAAEFPKTGSVFTLTSDIGFFSIDTVGYLNSLRVLPKNFFKNTFRAQNYMPLFWNFVFYTDFTMGYVRTFQSTSTVEDIPQFDRFYMGGGALDIGSIQMRGYGGRKVGGQAVTESGISYPIGGTSMVKYSAEIRLPVIPNPTMFILGFAEAGNVFQSLKTTDPFQVKRSIGYGFRLFMPLVGVIGLDVAYGLDRKDKSRNFPKLHFQLGQQF
ncbi:MAG TPA: outer membrane protein assembly factor BamA [bacterium]|nr:outer membrane protein assembly factor BamA [bacterium]HMZ05412.1 outer membrane protein assembly factor BamA [bacterium]HNC47674.1 outer membrane protein assembly factor BamA [bacterium]HNH29326.1 outer membrane protein assembly factor BamA [bacterium]HNH31741.1 outer membrane protein assembly factor BamA [bacterium]